jgi:hypothetical protein
MAKIKLIKRLVKEIDTVDMTPAENLPLEHYELKELAKTRVLLKGSIKVHAIVFLFVNIFLTIINLFADTRPISTIYDLWFLWSFVGWGLIFFAHFVIVFTINIDNLEQRIFAITVSILLYIIGFLIFINYFVNDMENLSYLWWPWPAVALALFSAAYAYIVFEHDDKKKMEKRIGKEILKIKEEETTRTEKIEAKKSRSEN